MLAAFSALPAPAQTTDRVPSITSALDGELFYQLLLGELNVRGAEPATGFALILDAARKTNDAQLYRRAVDIAFQSRSGDAALQAARAWQQAQPQSREAARYVLQILVALNRIEDSAQALKGELALISANDLPAAMTQVPRLYARATDKKLVARVLEQALADYLQRPDVAAATWVAVGRLRQAAEDNAGALEAARRAQGMDLRSEAAVQLALDLMDPKLPQAEAIVRRHITEGQAAPAIRMGYARALLDAQRYAEAAQQLRVVTIERPDMAEAWLVQGSLQVQEEQNDAAEASLRRYLAIVQDRPVSEEQSRGLAQAYIALSQIAESRKDFAAAEAWLARIENPQDLSRAQNRRASILARQGRVDEARALLRNLPERTPADARMKLMAEIQLLRDLKMYAQAYDLLSLAVIRDPKDTDLIYDQAMMAEKLGKLRDMERLLRQVIAQRPEQHHAYNALGYSLADRNIRLPEARQLIQKALEYAPGDPFITDSLGWVEFRMGNQAEALRLLDTAYKTRPDAEIAAHLGEVLWTMGQRERALAIWKEGLLLNAQNETLLETMKRLGATP